MAAYRKAVGVVVFAGLLMLGGYLSGFLPISDDLFYSVWYKCDALAKWAIFYAIAILSKHFVSSTPPKRGLFYIAVCLEGWAAGNVADEFFLNPLIFQSSEIIGATIFAVWCYMDYKLWTSRIRKSMKKAMNLIWRTR